jgi:succinate dehydrogenase / fumarate reductase cytochrome b subunit
MIGLKEFARSSIGQKFTMALTGAGLITFVGVHLMGNFTLLLGAEAFNEYAHKLETLFHGFFIVFAEIGLVAFFGLHAVAGVTTYLKRRKARTTRYQVQRNAGGASHKGLASSSMIVTGPLILAFIVVHILQFKFGRGAGGEEAYLYDLGGETVRNLYRLVVEEFNKWPVALGYVAVMVLLGLHLRHGFWSAFQSVGANSTKFMPVLKGLALIVAVALALGFIYIPLHVLFFVDPASAVQAARATGIPGGGL